MLMFRVVVGVSVYPPMDQGIIIIIIFQQGAHFPTHTHILGNNVLINILY